MISLKWITKENLIFLKTNAKVPEEFPKLNLKLQKCDNKKNKSASEMERQSSIVVSSSKSLFLSSMFHHRRLHWWWVWSERAIIPNIRRTIFVNFFFCVHFFLLFSSFHWMLVHIFISLCAYTFCCSKGETQMRNNSNKTKRGGELGVEGWMKFEARDESVRWGVCEWGHWIAITLPALC